MSLFDNKYPYTDFHELNLDWILEHYKELVDSLNDINSWISEHKIEYNEALAELERISGEINTFEARINLEFERLKQENQQQINAALSALNTNIDNKIQRLENDIQTAINSMNAHFNELVLQINNEISSFKAQVNREIMIIRNSVTANNDFVFDYVENRLQQFIDSFPDLHTVYVYNPYRGYETDIQTAVNDIYSYGAIWSLTALQYDSLGLTAEEYDVLGLTAIEYDTMAYRLLYKDPNDYMISPFSGDLVPVKEVVTKLCYFHMEGLTAQEYDNKELTASEYDSLNLTAFDYDWFGEQLIA